MVYEKIISAHVGVNEITWDGSGLPDGTYTLLANARGISKTAKVTIDRSVYTYEKEIVLTITGLFIAAFALLVYLGIMQ